MAEFYYQKGHNEAKSYYYKKGYAQAMEDVKQELQRYKKRHEAIEASKYLSSTGKITYPYVFKRENENGAYEIIITPSRVEDSLGIEDLVRIPTITDEDIDAHSQVLISMGVKKPAIGVSSFENNSFRVGPSAYQNSSGMEIKKTETINEESALTVEKSRTAKRILDASSLSYVESDKEFTVFFENKKEKQSFCNDAGVHLCNN